MNSRYWNGKPSGIFSAICLGLSLAFKKIVSVITTYLFIFNLKKHGKHIQVLSGIVYRCPSKITVSDDCVIGHSTSLVTELNENGGEFFMGPHSSIGRDCRIDFSGGIWMGNSAHIAHEVMISTHDHGYDYRNPPIGKPLTIGDFAFIGSRSIILHNCNRIGTHAVVGTGSVVTKDVPDYAIVAGNPAKIISFVLADGKKS